MTLKYPFGKPDQVTKADDNNDTPQQKKFEAATGKDSDSAVGDVGKKKVETGTDPSASGVKAPSGVNKEVWAQAEAAVIGKNGGFSGVGEEGRKTQIQEQYDQMVKNDKQTKAWAGHEPGPGGILGDL